MTATILLVDGDPAGRRDTAAVLEGAGFRVRAHGERAAALADAAAVEPDALVWDLRTPEDAALGLLRAYARRFPARATPAAVLSASADPADVARALEGGADDCLPRPVTPAILVATLRARLRSRAASVLRGDLAALPFARLMQLCERTGLTGELEVEGARVEFVAGSLAPGRRAAAARLLALRGGAFVLRARPAILRPAAATGGREAAAPAATPHHPPGRLSGVRIGERALQLQTEYTTVPEPRVVTVVMLEGRTVHQRATPAPAGASRDELERLVTAQHGAVEGEVQARIGARAARPKRDAPQARFDRLHDEGLDRFLDGDFAAAVRAWEEALRIHPGNQALSVNLAVARRKRDAAGRGPPGA